MEELFNDPKIKRYLKYFLWGALIVYIIPLIILLLFISDTDFSRIYNYTNSISGLILPLIAIAAAFLTFIAFWVQYQANQKQWDIIKSERIINNFISEFLYLNEQIKDSLSKFDDGTICPPDQVRVIYNEAKLLVNFYELNYVLINDVSTFPITMYSSGLKSCKLSIERIEILNTQEWIGLGNNNESASEFIICSELKESLESLIKRCEAILAKINL